MSCAFFIDGEYLGRVLLNQFGGVRIDYGKLIDEILLYNDFSRRDLLRVYYYDALPWMPRHDEVTFEDEERRNKKRNFFYALDYLQKFEVRLGWVIRSERDDSYYFNQQGVDVTIAVDMTRLAVRRQIDQAILIAGDGNLLPIIPVVKDEGVIVQLVYGEDPSPPKSLVKECDERTKLTDEMINASE